MMTTSLSNRLRFREDVVVPSGLLKTPNYTEAEQQFVQLLNLDDLDQQINQQTELVEQFEARLRVALDLAYTEAADEDARLFLQRILYRINRLNLFWYDDLQHYKNERSYYLQQVRDRIESVWQAWEISHFDIASYQQLDIRKELTERAEVDLNPPVTENKRYLCETLTIEGYRWLLAIVSLDGLVEASRMSRILGGASNEVQAMLIRVLMEEYGNGRFNRKHSTFFAQMMKEVDLRTEPEAYFDLAPWELLASINHNFLLTECKRHFLRYNGGLTYFEIVGPSIYRDYMAAAGRLGLSDTAMGYWELHIREDERHGQWMLQDVAFPLAKMYVANAWELVLGYDQEKLIGDRAGNAIISMIQMAEQSGNKVV
jgi:Iron-containing redox enzyme